MTMNALIQTEDLRNQLESTNPPILIDVRLEDDFKTAHIPRAINNCVFEVAFQKRLVAAVPDRTQPIIVYGADSESHEARIAAEKLRRGDTRPSTNIGKVSRAGNTRARRLSEASRDQPHRGFQMVSTWLM